MVRHSLTNRREDWKLAGLPHCPECDAKPLVYSKGHYLLWECLAYQSLTTSPSTTSPCPVGGA